MKIQNPVMSILNLALFHNNKIKQLNKHKLKRNKNDNRTAKIQNPVMSLRNLALNMRTYMICWSLHRNIHQVQMMHSPTVVLLQSEKIKYSKTQIERTQARFEAGP